MENNVTAVQMPKYRSHKDVWALKIKEVKADQHPFVSATLVFEESDIYAPRRVSAEYVEKHKPEAGGYFVVYKDGYESFSPAKAFEEGYTRI